MSPTVARMAVLAAWLGLQVGVAGLGAQPQDRVADAENALRTGRYDDAISQFTDIARRQPESARAAKGMVESLAAVGRYEDAEGAARRYNRSNPESPQLLNSLGEVLVLRGKLDAAEEAFARAIEEGASEAVTARLNLAVLRYDRGEREEASSEFDRFIDVYNRGRGLSSDELTAVATAVRYLGVDDHQLYRDALRAYDEAIAADPANIEPRILVGELFLEKYQSGEAAASFADVLAVNPHHPRALLGMARRARFDGSPQAMELVLRSLEANSNLVEARAFLAGLLIELESYEAAAGEADRALDVNPASLDALAMLAAARYLSGDRRGFEAAERRALSLNPVYAGLYTTLAEMCARNRLYQVAKDFAARAVDLDPKSWRGYALLGINQLRTGAIEEGKRNLETAFDGDPYDLWTKNTLDLLDNLGQYAQTRTDRFLISIDRTESELLALYMGELAEEAYDRLQAIYGYRPATPIQVEVYPNHADFSVRTVGLVGLGALGVSFGPVIAMDSPSARETGEFNWGSTLWHELAHTFHLGMTDHRVPRWFSEGLAVYEERRARPGWGDDVSLSFLAAYAQGRLLPVGELNNGFARPAYPEQLIHSYYEASLVCEFIERETGPHTLVRMLAAYRDGLSTPQVFENVIATDVDEFSDRFFAYLDERFAGPLAAMRPGRAEGGRPSREEIARRAESDRGDYMAQLGYGHILFEERRLEEAVGYLERAKRLIPDYAGPGSPYWYLALIHKLQGSLERASDELAALTAINERDYQAHLELAEVREALGDRDGAAGALERAIYISPYDMTLHARLAAMYSEAGEAQKAIRERRAVLALDPVDRAEALYQLSLAYFEAGDVANARRIVLRALEDAPSFEKAQDLLLEIRASRGGGTG
jgi:tetratricopeptide (TPR) repeat protein